MLHGTKNKALAVIKVFGHTYLFVMLHLIGLVPLHLRCFCLTFSEDDIYYLAVMGITCNCLAHNIGLILKNSSLRFNSFNFQ